MQIMKRDDGKEKIRKLEKMKTELIKIIWSFSKIEKYIKHEN